MDRAAAARSRAVEAIDPVRSKRRCFERNDPRTVSLVRHGRYELRLVELPRKLHTGTKQLWLELFDHHYQLTIDSYGGRNLVDIAAAAETLCSKAKDLSESTD
jgi:hypothetical protein